MLAALRQHGTFAADEFRSIFAPTTVPAGVVVGKEHIQRLPQTATQQLPAPRRFGGGRQP